MRNITYYNNKKEISNWHHENSIYSGREPGFCLSVELNRALSLFETARRFTVMDITFLKEWLVGAVGILQFVLETASAICVFTGFILTVCIAMKSRQEPAANPAIKLTFGRWLLLALELQLAADILNTTVDPDIEGLVKLFGIALIRTFLNYFLTREIDIQEKHLSVQKTEQNLS